MVAQLQQKGEKKLINALQSLASLAPGSVGYGGDMLDTVSNYYHRIREADIGVIAEEMHGDGITSRSSTQLQCDCPNHSSQSQSSMHIDLRKQCWYCFGCRKGGDVLQLVEFVKYGTVTSGVTGTMPNNHREARAFLARKVGIKDLCRMDIGNDVVADIEGEHISHMHVLDALWWLAESGGAQAGDEATR